MHVQNSVVLQVVLLGDEGEGKVEGLEGVLAVAEDQQLLEAGELGYPTKGGFLESGYEPLRDDHDLVPCVYSSKKLLNEQKPHSLKCNHINLLIA
jgi:hypothetical protein